MRLRYRVPRMPLYQLEAADAQGRKVRQSREAPSEAALKADLAREGLYPLSINEEKERKGFALTRGVSRKDLLTFTQELGSLLEAGLPVDRAIYALSVHTEKQTLREILLDVYSDLQRGQSLSQSLGKHKEFPPLYVNMVRAGEIGGILEAVVKRLAAFLEASVAFQEEFATALVYPAMLTLVGGAAVTFIIVFVVPKFAVMFRDMGQAMPMPTQILLGISSFVAGWWWAIIAAAVVIAAGARSYVSTAEGRALIDTWKLRLPMVGELEMKAITARFARTLGTLLESGVPILEAIRVSREVVGNVIVGSRLDVLEEGVRKGKGISGPLRDCGIFPPLALQMVAVGEEAGRVEHALLGVADRYEAESRNALKRATSLVAPALILLMSVIVGFIVISMLLAVFSLNDLPV